MAELRLIITGVEAEGRARDLQAFAEGHLNRAAFVRPLEPGVGATKGIDPELMQVLQASAYVVTIVGGVPAWR